MSNLFRIAGSPGTLDRLNGSAVNYRQLSITTTTHASEFDGTPRTKDQRLSMSGQTRSFRWSRLPLPERFLYTSPETSEWL